MSKKDITIQSIQFRSHDLPVTQFSQTQLHDGTYLEALPTYDVRGYPDLVDPYPGVHKPIATDIRLPIGNVILYPRVFVYMCLAQFTES